MGAPAFRYWSKLALNDLEKGRSGARIPMPGGSALLRLQLPISRVISQPQSTLFIYPWNTVVAFKRNLSPPGKNTRRQRVCVLLILPTIELRAANQCIPNLKCNDDHFFFFHVYAQGWGFWNFWKCGAF